MTPPLPRYEALLEALGRHGRAGVAYGLERMQAVLAIIRPPPPVYGAVQIVGTNGKGSTAAMVAAILRAHGLKTGLFTSPHLLKFAERFDVDGEHLDERVLLDAYEIVMDGAKRADVDLSYFEVATLLAVVGFAHARVDAAVYEAGLGGRFDATTAVDCQVQVLTSVGLDHTELLGPTREAIGIEKAAAARPGVPFFVPPLITSVAKAVEAQIAQLGGMVKVVREGAHDTVLSGLTLPLGGEHQRQNARLACAAARALLTHRARAAGPSGRRGRASSGLVAWEDHRARAGLEAVRWPGRLQWVTEDVLVDTAHNVDSAAALARVLESWPSPPALVFSALEDKDASATLRALQGVYERIWVAPCSHPRSADAATLELQATRAGAGAVRACPTMAQALAEARAWAASFRRRVVVAGSCFAVGDTLALLTGAARDPLFTADPRVRQARG